MAYILSIQLFAFNTFHSTESLDNKASLLQVPCYSFRHINQDVVSAKKKTKRNKRTHRKSFQRPVNIKQELKQVRTNCKHTFVATVAMLFGGLKHQRQQLEPKIYSYTKKSSIYITTWTRVTSQYGAIQSLNLV